MPASKVIYSTLMALPASDLVYLLASLDDVAWAQGPDNLKQPLLWKNVASSHKKIAQKESQYYVRKDI